MVPLREPLKGTPKAPQDAPNKFEETRRLEPEANAHMIRHAQASSLKTRGGLLIGAFYMLVLIFYKGCYRVSIRV